MRPVAAFLFLAGIASAHAATTVDWRADVEYLCDELPSRHVAPFHTLSRTEFERRCGVLADDAGTMNDVAAVAAIAELVAAVGDGHTRLTLPLAPQAGLFATHTSTDLPRVAPFHQLPIRVAALVDGYVVTRTSPELHDLLGARVTRVAGLPIERAVGSLWPLIHGDNDGQRRSLSASFLVVPELLAARGLLGADRTVRFEFEMADGRRVTRALDAVPSNVSIEWTAIDPPAGRPLYLDDRAGHYFMSRLPGTSFVYARLTQVSDRPEGESLTAFTEQLFATLADTRDAGLIIDLRGNPGGNNSFAAPIVRGVIRDRRLTSPGRLFVITDGETFSAAVTLAVELERWTPAIFVGAATGGRPNGYGDARRFTLPHSGLTVRASTLYWQSSVPTDERDAIAPLLPAPVTIEDRRAGRDPALAAISAYVAAAGDIDGAWHGTLAIAQRLTDMDLEVTGDGIEPSLAGTFSAPDLGVSAAKWRGSHQAAGEITGRVALSSRYLELRARVAGDLLIGTVEYLGTPYPFIASRQNGLEIPSKATVAMPIQ